MNPSLSNFLIGLRFPLTRFLFPLFLSSTSLTCTFRFILRLLSAGCRLENNVESFLGFLNKIKCTKYIAYFDHSEEPLPSDQQ
jgi:hypothetical protein